MFRDAKCPAKFGATSRRVSMSRLLNPLCRNASVALGSLECVGLDGTLVFLKIAGCLVDEFLVGKTGRDNFPCHRICKGNVRTDVNAEPHVRPLSGSGPARIDDEEFRAAANALQQMVEKDGVGLPCIRTPQEDDVRFFNFAVGTCSTPRSENRRQTGDAWGVSSAVTTVDVVAADDGADKLLRDVVQLIRGF